MNRRRIISRRAIDLQGITLSPVGNWSMYLTGSFNENGHIIQNATIDIPGDLEIGLFGIVGISEVIRNLRVEDVNLNGLPQSLPRVIEFLVNAIGCTLGQCEP